MRDLKDLFPDYNGEKLQRDAKNLLQLAIHFSEKINAQTLLRFKTRFMKAIEDDVYDYEGFIHELPPRLLEVLGVEFKKRGFELPVQNLQGWIEEDATSIGRNRENYMKAIVFLQFLAYCLIGIGASQDNLDQFSGTFREGVEHLRENPVQVIGEKEITFPLQISNLYFRNKATSAPPNSPLYEEEPTPERAPRPVAINPNFPSPTRDYSHFSPQGSSSHLPPFEEPDSLDPEIQGRLIFSLRTALNHPYPTIAKVQKSIREGVLQRIPVLQHHQQELTQVRAQAQYRRTQKEAQPPETYKDYLKDRIHSLTEELKLSKIQDGRRRVKNSRDLENSIKKVEKDTTQRGLFYRCENGQSKRHKTEDWPLNTEQLRRKDRVIRRGH